MKRGSIKQHLRKYSIFQRRLTTINHAFASAIAPYDEYDELIVCQALRELGQDPDGDLNCCYCEERCAETWDHVVGLVKGKEFSGYGHSLGNLLPACRACNSEKGNKPWRTFLEARIGDDEKRGQRLALIENYLAKYQGKGLDHSGISKVCPELIHRFEAARLQILQLMKEADALADAIRAEVVRSRPQGETSPPETSA